MSVRRLVYVALLGALALVAMAAIQVPLMPAARYLTWDPADVVALWAALAWGPAAGVLVQVVKDLLFLFLRAHSPFGPLADLLAGGVMVAVAGWVGGGRTSPGRALLAVLLGVLARAAVMIPANLVILPLQFGLPLAKVWGLMWSVLVPFNLIKGGLNGGLAVVALAGLRRRVPAFRPEPARESQWKS